MKAFPAIALLIVGAALCGGALELFTPDTDPQTMAFDELLAALGGWLLSRFIAIARTIAKTTARSIA